MSSHSETVAGEEDPQSIANIPSYNAMTIAAAPEPLAATDPQPSSSSSSSINIESTLAVSEMKPSPLAATQFTKDQERKRLSPLDSLKAYRESRDNNRPTIYQKYNIIGFISSGTYGRVYKAKSVDNKLTLEYAIKKFKPDKEGDSALQSGLSQSACREIALCRELSHENVVALAEVLLGPSDRSIYMVFEYAEHDLLQILHFHGLQERKPIPEYSVKSFLWQLLNGLAYLHANWVLHRDLKPANILVTAGGVVKIGDLGLARLFYKPLQPLFNGDKVVVTIWYRAIELLLGSRHYTKAVDMWAVGCIFAELLTLRPIFKGDEAKMDNKKNIPFQKDQCGKIFEVLGTPTRERWPAVEFMPEYSQLSHFRHHPGTGLHSVFQATGGLKSASAADLLRSMLEYDPLNRISAEDALNHQYFFEEPRPSLNSFVKPGVDTPFFKYPSRRITRDDTDMKTNTKADKPITSKSTTLTKQRSNSLNAEDSNKRPRLK